MESIHQKVVELMNDADFKAAFIANLKNAKPGLTANGLEQEWRNAISLIHRDKVEFENISFNALSVSKLKRGLLCASEYGLSFLPERREMYLMANFDMCNNPSMEIRLGYNGMQILLMRTGQIATFAYDVVYEGDTFTWYGMNNRPTHTRSDGSSFREIKCGYSSFELKDKSVISCFVSKEEIDEAVNIRNQMSLARTGTLDESLVNGPYRHKMLNILIVKKTYHELKNFLELRGATVVKDPGEGVILSDDAEFLKVLEQEMNRGAKHA
jgi:hypothetical protein